ncbi:MAG: hypothetical protein EKK65_08810 [Lysobacterales bacterium]|nr:MAG: hypothetical protein EKK65_08810 [Xanthomonadales bacterium]
MNTPTPTPAPHDFLLQFFTYDHLPAHLQTVSRSFATLAHQLVNSLPSNPERTTAYALLEQVLDGGMCVHCGRQTAVERRWDDAELLAELSAVGACVYAYDPETKRYRRSCEGDTR